jgi:glycerol-3-phosphate dehydrogenase
VAFGRPFRAYWGVRALPTSDADDPTDHARAATVVDHEERDGLWGLTSVFGGKLTTHRATAERVVDRVCATFGIRRPCRTADLALPSVPPDGDSETRPAAGTDAVVCDAGSVSRGAVRAVLDHDVLGNDGLRTAARRTGAGMGACQGARCAHRLAAEVDRRGAVGSIDRALADFADVRWSGRRWVLWDDGFASAMSAYDFNRRTLRRTGERDSPTWERFDAGRADDTGAETGG